MFCSRGCYCFSWLGNMGACLLNKCWEWRQNDMRMRVERLQKVMEGEYAWHLRGVMKYRYQRVCMNIIRIYEQRMRELLGFYVLRVWAMNKFIAYFIWWYLCRLYTYMLEPLMNSLRMEQKINPRTKGMQGNLKMGDRWQEWMGIVTKVVNYK